MANTKPVGVAYSDPALVAGTTIDGAVITNPTITGATTAGAVAATTLSASGAVSGAGFTALFASPPAIGGTAAAAVTGTTITASTQLIGKGTATNDSAAAGYIGEFVSGTAVAGSVSLTTATTANITSISLTAGDWDVSGGVTFTTAASTSVTQAIAGISTTTATLGADGTYARNTIAAFVPGAIEWLDQISPTVRISVAATTTVYLVGQSTFTVSTQTAGGFITARRVR